MLSAILSRLFPPDEHRVLMVGLDAAGKTTLLYRWKLPELGAITTIPTIGFNVEDVKYHDNHFVVWDVGGCDKIKPLWRHYFQNTHLIVYVIDSNDHTRLDADAYSGESVVSSLNYILDAEEIDDVPILFVANKMDLPGAYSVEEIDRRLNIEAMKSRRSTCVRDIRIASCIALNSGSCEALFPIMADMIDKHNAKKSSSASVKKDTIEETTNKNTTSKMEKQFEEWISRVDETDEEFISQLEDLTLDDWDHRTHLRIAFILLKKYGRREGMKQIFHKIKYFINNSTRTKRSHGTTFHETMAYFWIHMVHFAMISSNISMSGDEDRPVTSFQERGSQTYNRLVTASVDAGVELSEFKFFLLLNPHLANGGLFLTYYSKKLMLDTPESRTQVMLPDIKPLPSIIPSSSIATPATTHATSSIKSFQEMSDDEFMQGLVEKTLTGWGHQYILRVIYCIIQQYGRDRDTLKLVKDKLRLIEKEHVHTTITYFWIHIMTICLASYKAASKTATAGDSPLSYHQFTAKKLCLNVLDSQLIYQYYSVKVLDNDSAKIDFILPDLKPLPNKL